MSFQKCPVCQGCGKDEFTSVCFVCNGKGIISELTGLPPKENDKIESKKKCKKSSCHPNQCSYPYCYE